MNERRDVGGLILAKVIAVPGAKSGDSGGLSSPESTQLKSVTDSCIGLKPNTFG